MTRALRPRRSVLYMPGANERALEKAKGIAGRRADPRPRGRGGARTPRSRPGSGCAPRRSRASTAPRRSRSASTGSSTEWHADDLRAVGRGRPDGRRGAQGQHRRRRAPDREGASRRPARPTAHEDLGDGRDAGGHAARRGDRRRVGPAGRAGDGHQRPGQGAPRRARARVAQPLLTGSGCACWRPGRPAR